MNKILKAGGRGGMVVEGWDGGGGKGGWWRDGWVVESWEGSGGMGG